MLEKTQMVKNMNAIHVYFKNQHSRAMQACVLCDPESTLNELTKYGLLWTVGQ